MPGTLHPVGFWSEPAGGGGDTIDLQAASAQASGTGDQRAEIRVYNAGTREGEMWYEDAGFTYQNDVIDPGSNANDYQMQWVSLSGDDPTGTGTVAKTTWFALSSGDFRVIWEAPAGGNEETGEITVNIRKGTGSTLDTAVWDGEAISVKKGQ